MNKTLKIAALGILMVLPCTAQQTLSNDIPPSEGTYYKSPQGWQQLQQLMMSGGGAKHIGKVFVPGLTPQMVWTFRGAQAPIQISERRPTFYVRQSPYLDGVAGHSQRDLLIVRFDKKKDHREPQVTSGGNMFTLKAGFSKDRTPDILVTQIAPGLLTVSPASELSPGEYLLTLAGTGTTGYDFGIN